VAALRPPKRERLAAGALALALARWETLDQGLRGAARGLPFEAPAGGPCFLWGKFFDAVILILLFLCVFSYNGFPYAHFSFLRLNRTLEQAQPSMAKRLKVGAASKDLGWLFIPVVKGFVLFLCRPS